MIQLDIHQAESQHQQTEAVLGSNEKGNWNIKYILRQRSHLADGQINPQLWKLSTLQWSQLNSICTHLQLPILTEKMIHKFLSQIKNRPQIDLFFSWQQAMKASSLFAYERKIAVCSEVAALLRFSVLHLHATRDFETDSGCVCFVLKVFTEPKMGIFNRTSTTASVKCLWNYGFLHRRAPHDKGRAHIRGGTCQEPLWDQRTSTQRNLHICHCHPVWVQGMLWALLSAQDIAKTVTPKPLWNTQPYFSLLGQKEERKHAFASCKCYIGVVSKLLLAWY